MYAAMNNTNTNSSSDIPPQMVATKTILYSLILVWSLFGNILVLVVILRNKGLKTNFNFLIVNMAIADLVIPCLALPMKIAHTNLRHMEWLVDGDFGDFLCKLCYFVADTSPVVSSFCLVIIAVNRFFAIAVPMQGLLTRRRTLCLVAGTWIMAIALLSPYLYTYKVEETDYTMCISTWSPGLDDTAAEAVFCVILITVVFVFPCITIFILYTVMLCKLRQNSNKVAYMLNNKQFRRRQRKDKNIFIMTVVIMFLYLVLWGPFFCTLFVLSFIVEQNKDNTASVQTTITTVQFLGYLNSAVNPCIYFYFLNNLRQGLKRVLRRMFLLQKTESLTFSRSARGGSIMARNSTKKKRSSNSNV